ncbi:MAG: discoidin domain-containing protein [Candidatus Aminicenantales bacterium]
MCSISRMLEGLALVCVGAVLWTGGRAQAQEEARRVVVDSAPSRMLNSFSPVRALGAGVDRLRTGVADKALGSPFLDEILSAGWQSVTYRQNTELHVEAWHWNPRGTWSDPAGRGYFTGDPEPGGPIRHSYAYPLPRRGFTRNSGTERGYSRLTDGDLETYWKSNPYLTRAFTGEDDALHPQWVTLDLGDKLPIDAVRIAWAEPFARTYLIQFWTGDGSPVDSPTKGHWQTFPLGNISDGRGGTVTVRLATGTIPVRYLRIWMTASSNTRDPHGSADRRDYAGYAIRELYAGTVPADGRFQDLIRHSADGKQTATLCSSVDPWHQAQDLDEKLGDQVGFDFFFTCGVTRGLPAMVPVAMIYSTPEDAAAEISYLEKRHYPISYVEMGEEPDGQYMLPEDYAALYLQFASAIHRVDPKLKLGGPAFQGVNNDVEVWPDAEGRVSWLGRFIDYLKARGRLNDFAFLSFEHYPYDPCRTTWSDLYAEPELITHIMQVWRDDGLPADVPMFVTEVNLSWQTGETFVDIMGGLWFADYTGAFLAGGGDASYFFHYVPSPLHAGCNDSWGSFGLFNVDADFRVKGRFAQYFASRLLTREWAQPVDATHRVFRASSDVRDAAGNILVTAYALERPDGAWSLLLINKDREKAHAVRIALHEANGKNDRFLSGSVDLVSFGAAQYEWHADGARGYADPDGPAVRTNVTGEAKTEYLLPKASITVIRGKAGG